MKPELLQMKTGGLQMNSELTTAQTAIIKRVGLVNVKDALIIELSFKLDAQKRIIEQMQANVDLLTQQANVDLLTHQANVDLLTQQSNVLKNELLRANFNSYCFRTYPDDRYEPNKWNFPMVDKEFLVKLGISLEEQVAWIREYEQSHNEEDQDE